jgi:hypothetical protein
MTKTVSCQQGAVLRGSLVIRCATGEKHVPKGSVESQTQGTW